MTTTVLIAFIYQAPGFLQQQIIDVEKLKRLDELDNAESDWTKSDNTFDYNKKIASDDEEDFHSDWTSQIKPSKSATAIAAQAPANSEPPQQLLNNSSQQVRPLYHIFLSKREENIQQLLTRK